MFWGSLKSHGKFVEFFCKQESGNPVITMLIIVIIIEPWNNTIFVSSGSHYWMSWLCWR